MIRTLFAIGLLLSVTILSVAQESEVPIKFDDKVFDGPTEIYSYSNGIQYGTSLPDDPQGPIWTADQAHPPFSAAEAIRKAIAKRKELVKDDDRWRWGLVSASIVPWENEDGYWYWLVTSELHVRQGGSSGPTTNFELVVLMDGTVIEPNADPDWDR